jgi:hypothetical protein
LNTASEGHKIETDWQKHATEEKLQRIEQKALHWRKTLVQQNANEECLEPCGGQGKSFGFMECTFIIT